MFKLQKGERWALCALLSIWICVIIPHSIPADGQTIAAEAGARRPVLILDPGHGGTDGGAVSVTGQRESAINWQITRRAYDLALFLGIDAVMTRGTEEIDYPPELASISARKKWDTRERVRIVNGIGSGVLVSIHQNCYPGSAPRGAQVLYRDDETSRTLAQMLQRELSAAIPGTDKRTASKAGKDIYLMSHVENPAVLVESGFLSNNAEALLLESLAHQKKIAMIITGVYYVFTGDETA